MTDPAVSRAPFEIWEIILLEVINGTSSPIFDTTCTSSNYLAFKQTCFELSTDFDEDLEYASRALERDRLTVRSVCRTWKAIADRWDNRERWLCISGLDKPISAERWRGAQRIDFFSPRSKIPQDIKRNDDAIEKSPVLFTFFDLHNTVGKGPMRLKKLSIHELPYYNFINVIKALCGASQVLTSLRSLNLAIYADNQPYLKMISEHFPDLTHLTLQAHCQPDRWHKAEVLNLPNLEVLMLILESGFFQLSDWILPALRHLFIGPNHDRCLEVRFGVPQFMNRFGSQLETLDMGNLFIDLITGSSVFDGERFIQTRTAPPNFWHTFPCLKNLGCDLEPNVFWMHPEARHPFKCLMPYHGDISSAANMKEILDLWVWDDHVKKLESVVVYGPYLSSGAYLKDEAICSLLRARGIRLLNLVGEPWIDAP